MPESQIELISIPSFIVDSPLIDTLEVSTHFGESEDTIELHIFSEDDSTTPLISVAPFYDFTIPNAGETNTEISLDPQKILHDNGILQGKYKLIINVLRKKIFNLPDHPFVLKEISPSRTELRSLTPNIQNATLDPQVSNFITEIETSIYFKQFTPRVSVSLD